MVLGAMALVRMVQGAMVLVQMAHGIRIAVANKISSHVKPSPTVDLAGQAVAKARVMKVMVVDQIVSARFTTVKVGDPIGSRSVRTAT